MGLAPSSSWKGGMSVKVWVWVSVSVPVEDVGAVVVPVEGVDMAPVGEGGVSIAPSWRFNKRKAHDSRKRSPGEVWVWVWVYGPSRKGGAGVAPHGVAARRRGRGERKVGI